MHGRAQQRALLSEWPIRRPANWRARVNAVLTRKEREAVERSMRKSCPYGDAQWREEMARRLGLEHTLRERGRPAEDDEE